MTNFMSSATQNYSYSMHLDLSAVFYLLDLSLKFTEKIQANKSAPNPETNRPRTLKPRRANRPDKHLQHQNNNGRRICQRVWHSVDRRGDYYPILTRRGGQK